MHGVYSLQGQFIVGRLLTKQSVYLDVVWLARHMEMVEYWE